MTQREKERALAAVEVAAIMRDNAEAALGLTILEARAAGATIKEIAARGGVSIRTIYRVMDRAKAAYAIAEEAGEK